MYTYIYIYVYMYVCICICVCTYIYIYIYIYGLLRVLLSLGRPRMSMILRLPTIRPTMANYSVGWYDFDIADHVFKQGREYG